MAQGIIYMFTNKENGKMYIGQTMDEVKRIRRHLYAASHPNLTKNEGQPFIKALREYGVEAFDYERLFVSDETDNIEELKELLNQKGQEYIEIYDAVKNGYNVTKGGAGMLGYTLPQDIIDRIREKNRGRHISEKHKEIVRKSTKSLWTDEYRKFMSERMSGSNNPMYGVRLIGSLNPMYGKPKSEETRKKISEAKKGKQGHPCSEVLKIKLREKFSGVPKSDEHKEKLRQANLGKRCPDKWRAVLQYSLNGEFLKEWDCLSDAQEHYKNSHIGDCCLGKRGQASNCMWKYKSGENYPRIIPPFKKQRVRKIALIDKDDNVLKIFDSIKQAAIELNINYSTLLNVLKGNQKKTGDNLFFKYI